MAFFLEYADEDGAAEAKAGLSEVAGEERTDAIGGGFGPGGTGFFCGGSLAGEDDDGDSAEDGNGEEGGFHGEKMGGFGGFGI